MLKDSGRWLACTLDHGARRPGPEQFVRSVAVACAGGSKTRSNPGERLLSRSATVRCSFGAASPPAEKSWQSFRRLNQRRGGKFSGCDVPVMVHIAAIVVGSAGFYFGRASAPKAADAHSRAIARPTPGPSPSTDTDPVLGRADIIAMVATATDALVAGAPVPGKIRSAVGRRFELSVPFGCAGPAEQGSLELLPWRYDESEETLRLHVEPTTWSLADLGPARHRKAPSYRRLLDRPAVVIRQRLPESLQRWAVDRDRTRHTGGANRCGGAVLYGRNPAGGAPQRSRV